MLALGLRFMAFDFQGWMLDKGGWLDRELLCSAGCFPTPKATAFRSHGKEYLEGQEYLEGREGGQ